ncbi:MAG: CRTAC1 family protein [Planctomycetota bacterium]|nr:MAG: CRTAC1 family protein [Planctomycetota bacterium]
MFLSLMLALQAPPAAQFRDVGATALPDVKTTCGTAAKEYIIEVNGGGVALGDFDGDGDPDLVVVDGSTLERVQRYEAANDEERAKLGAPGYPPRLFLNQSTAAGIRFEPAGDAWKMSGGRWGMGCATGDFDGDGWLDLVVTQWGPTRLFLNQAGKGFREVDKPGFVGDGWSTSAAAFDYDADGWLDLAVIRYLAFDTREIASRSAGKCRWKELPVMCGPEGLTPVHDQLFHNGGASAWRAREPVEGQPPPPPAGTSAFTDATMSAGFRPSNAAFGLGAMPLDYDRDGDADLFVANDSQPNCLWENRGGTFAEVGFARGVATTSSGKELASMGIGCNDVDGDGLAELFVTVFSGEENALFRPFERPPKNGAKLPPMFKESGGPLGLGGPSRPLLGWGTALEDYDHDGDLDAHVFNGHVYPQADEPGTDSSYAQQDQLYRNVSALRAKPKFAPELLSDAGPRVSRASAAADLDGDGDLDLVALELGGSVRVLENRGAQPDTHWLRVALRSAGPNTMALGARVTVKCGDVVRTREIRTSGGYQAAIPPDAHFGLGAAAVVDELEVVWPDGRVQVLKSVPVDRALTIQREEGSK